MGSLLALCLACTGTDGTPRSSPEAPTLSLEQLTPLLQQQAGLPEQARDPTVDRQKPLDLYVDVDESGLILTSVGDHGWITPLPPIPIQGTTYDYAALGTKIAELHELFPGEPIVRIGFMPEISLEVVADVVIEVRGPDCRLSADTAALESTCRLWATAIALPDEATRSTLTRLLVARGLPPVDAAWSTMEQPVQPQRASLEARRTEWSRRQRETQHNQQTRNQPPTYP